MKIFHSFTDNSLVDLLEHGAIGVIPTDTVYGIVTSAANKSSVAKLYELKHREHKPGTIIAASIDQLIALGVTARYLKAVAGFWPNPISIEIPLESELEYLHQGLCRQAFRIPKDDVLHDFLSRTGPLLTSSANLPGQPVARTMAEAQHYFGEQVDFYLDGGDLSGRKSSTIIRIIDDAIEVVRPGAVTIDETGRITQ